MDKKEMYDELIHEAIYQMNRDYEMYLMLLQNAYELRMEMDDDA